MWDFLLELSKVGNDHLFILAGLLFFALAVVGSVKGRFALGTFPRVVAGVIGALAVAIGLLITEPHVVIKSLEVHPQNSVIEANCPVIIPLYASIETEGNGSFIWRVKYSDGTYSQDMQQKISTSDPWNLLRVDWPVNRNVLNGFAVLEVTHPVERKTTTTVPITVSCAPHARKPPQGPDLLANKPPSLVPPQAGESVRSSSIAFPTDGWTGVWVEMHPKDGRPPLRLRIDEYEGQVQFLGHTVPIQDGTVRISETQGCAAQFQRAGFTYERPGTTSVSAKLAGDELVYSVKTTWYVQCDGHPPGEELVEYRLSRTKAP